MSSIMTQIELEQWDFFALEFGNIVESDFVYTLAFTNIIQSAPNLAKMYVIGSWMSSIMYLVLPESYFPLKLQKLLNQTLSAP